MATKKHSHLASCGINKNTINVEKKKQLLHHAHSTEPPNFSRRWIENDVSGASSTNCCPCRKCLTWHKMYGVWRPTTIGTYNVALNCGKFVMLYYVLVIKVCEYMPFIYHFWVLCSLFYSSHYKLFMRTCNWY